MRTFLCFVLYRHYLFSYYSLWKRNIGFYDSDILCLSLLFSFKFYGAFNFLPASYLIFSFEQWLSESMTNRIFLGALNECISSSTVYDVLSILFNSYLRLGAISIVLMSIWLGVYLIVFLILFVTSWEKMQLYSIYIFRNLKLATTFNFCYNSEQLFINFHLYKKSLLPN